MSTDPSSLSSTRDGKRQKLHDGLSQQLASNKKLSSYHTHSNYDSRLSMSQDPQQDDTDADKQLYLAAKYLQYKYLYIKTGRHVDQLKETTQHELDNMRKAVEFKQEQDLNRLEDKNQLMKHINHLNRVIDTIEYKMDMDEQLQQAPGDDQNYLVEEKRELQTILDEMRDLSIPLKSTHEDIKLIMEVRQSIQDFIEQTH
ncbi:hypothetical protein BDF20DRAFT_901485, partial [Mycotypha africana]|uniref:uncharacterized protein n=1 Tax=Mycotypha africana TaxID=64632 RepID=UPI0023008D4B